MNLSMNKKVKEILEELESEGKLKIWKDFQFPAPKPLKLRLKDMLEPKVDEKYYLSDKMIKYISATNDKWTGNNNGAFINKDIASTINTGEGQRRCDASNYIGDDFGDNYDLGCVKSGNLNHTPYEINDRVYSPTGISPTVRARLQGDTAYIDEDDSLLEQITIDDILAKLEGGNKDE